MAKDSIRVGPELDRLIVPASVGMWNDRTFGAIEPQEMSGILRAADRGNNLEQWADFCEWVCEDDRVSSVIDTRVDAVCGAPWDIQPADETPESKLAAEMCRTMLEATTGLEEDLEELANMLVVGYSLLEHDWVRTRGQWVSNPVAVRARDINIVNKWRVQARTHDASIGTKWINVDDHPNKFIVGVYKARGSTPLRSGLVRKVAWFWLFKRWALKYWVSGADRLGNPMMIGRVQRDAPEAARSALQKGLTNLSSGQVAMLEEGTGIEFPDTKFSVSADVWEALVRKCDEGITIAVLGSLDSVDGGENGSLARAESQAEQTMDPRKQKFAKLIYGIVERDWLRPYLYFNLDRFGGVMPRVPKMVSAIKVDKKIKDIQPFHLQGRLVTRDEVRSQLGLDPLPQGQGGNELLDMGGSVGADAGLPLASLAGTVSQGQQPRSSNQTSASARNTLSSPTYTRSPMMASANELASSLAGLPSSRPKRR